MEETILRCTNKALFQSLNVNPLWKIIPWVVLNGFGILKHDCLCSGTIYSLTPDYRYVVRALGYVGYAWQYIHWTRKVYVFLFLLSFFSKERKIIMSSEENSDIEESEKESWLVMGLKRLNPQPRRNPGPCFYELTSLWR